MPNFQTKNSSGHDVFIDLKTSKFKVVKGSVLHTNQPQSVLDAVVLASSSFASLSVEILSDEQAEAVKNPLTDFENETLKAEEQAKLEAEAEALAAEKAAKLKAEEDARIAAEAEALETERTDSPKVNKTSKKATNKTEKV